MEQKQFLNRIFFKAADNIRHIVLPEGDDERIIAAAKAIAKKKIAKLTILGDEEKIASELKAIDAPLDAIDIVNPRTSPKLLEYSEQFFNLRKSKGISANQAKYIIEDHIYFGTMMLYAGDCDGLVAGADHSTADTVRPALQIIKASDDVKSVSSMFFMCRDDDIYMFADCGLIEFPTESQVVDIIVSTAKTALQFNVEPRVGVLSYSTKGSARSEQSERMAGAAERAGEKLDKFFGEGKVVVDGELQFDAAFVPTVAAKKAPDSPLKGLANTFVFPDLGVGNICCKMAERLAKMDAYGPILQGLNKPVNDLSRGCSADDIVAVVAITAIQSMK